MSNITKEDLKHISKLAELAFDEDEADRITSQLDRILGHVAKISEANTENVTAMKNAPDIMSDGFKVPKID
jgi:aspartyl/glutamyl-tRNA(Asn/Gln) amidotransferase C subunit